MGATIVRELECKLTPKEWKDRARRLAQSPVERGAVETEAKRVAAEYKTKVGKLEEDEKRTAREVREGTCFRDVLCHEVKSFELNTVEMIRDDTQEVVEQRAMTGADHQGELGLPDPEDEEPPEDDSPIDGNRSSDDVDREERY